MAQTIVERRLRGIDAGLRALRRFAHRFDDPIPPRRSLPAPQHHTRPPYPRATAGLAESAADGALRLRLRADFDVSGYRGDARVILGALKTYGLIVADNGTSWFITGAADTRWDDDDLNQLKRVFGSAFEAVDTGPIFTP